MQLQTQKLPPRTKDIFNKKEDKGNCKGHQILSNLLNKRVLEKQKESNTEEAREQREGRS